MKTLQTGTPLILLFAENETVDDIEPLLATLPQFIRLSGVCPIIALSLRDTGVAAEDILPYADFRIYGEGIHENTAADMQMLDLPAAVEKLRALLYCLPLNCAENPPVVQYAGKRGSVRAANTVDMIADTGSAVEIYADPHLRIAFVRVNGKITAIIASDNGVIPQHAARFIQFCDCYSIPLLIVAEDTVVFTPLQLFVLSQSTATKILLGESANGSAAFDAVISKQAIDAAINALEYFSVKRDILPPHKHGNLPL